MNLPPDVVAFLAASPNESLDFLTVEDQRAVHRHLSEANHLRFGRQEGPVASIDEYRIPVGGQATIRVRAYRPSSKPALPAHLTLHGGSWWLGSIDERVNDAICRHRCVQAACVVFAVDYRLAPEHPFPTAVEDVYAVLCWIADHAAVLDIDADNMSIGGTSAGANIAAAVTQLAKKGGPGLVYQLLEVPALDLTGESFRKTLRRKDFQSIGGRAEDMKRYLNDFTAGLRRYLPDADDALLPLASPSRCDDLSGLPPAHIMTAQFDPLREEGERYARQLSAAGVRTTVTRHAGAIHGLDQLTRVWIKAREWQSEAAAALRFGLSGNMVGTKTG